VCDIGALSVRESQGTNSGKLFVLLDPVVT
jgi:hypothetical protein